MIDEGVVRRSRPRTSSRRRFLGTAGALLGSSWLAGLPACSREKNGLAQARRRAVGRRRRLILDDDGDLVYSPQAAKGAESFLALRLRPVVGTPVDSIAWCIMWGIAQGPGQTRYWETQQQDRRLNQAIQDPTPIMVEGARQNNLEIFGSLRMNDTHDAFGMPEGTLVYPLKVSHPEWLLGDSSQKGLPFTTREAAVWSGLNFAIPEVREDRLWWVRHTVESYEVDGIDLNFFRMPWYFKSGQEEAGASLMTDLIRRARRIVDRASESQQRPILLGVRVPGTLETCHRIGLDVETWLREHWLDRLLIGGGYTVFTNPARELVKLGRRYEVPVYPCINCGLGVFGSDEAMRGAASNIFSAGADGIYLWNYHYRKVPMLAYGQPVPTAYELLEDLQSASSLQFRNKHFGVDYIQEIGPYAIASHPGQLPLELNRGNPGSPATVRVPVGDDMEAAEGSGRFGQASLELEVEGLKRGERIAARLNQGRLELEAAPLGWERFRRRVDPPGLSRRTGQDPSGNQSARGLDGEERCANRGSDSAAGLVEGRLPFRFLKVEGVPREPALFSPIDGHDPSVGVMEPEGLWIEHPGAG